MYPFDEHSLETMISLIGPSVYRLAFSLCKNKYDADDVYQEVFIAYLRNKPSFVNEHHARGWFFKVCHNACKKLWRNPFYKKTESFEESFYQVDTTERADYKPLYRALSQLSINYRVVIHLFYFEEYSTLEISEILNVNDSTIRTRLSRARQQLKEILGSDVDV